MALEAAVITSSDVKFALARGSFESFGIAAHRLLVDYDLPEREDVSPRKVLKDKLTTFAAEAQTMIVWAALKLGHKPQAVVTFDTLGLRMESPRQSFGDAKGVNKKPDGCPALVAVANHFREIGRQPEIDGYLWEGVVPGAASAPVDRRTGRVDGSKIVPRWDKPWSFGYAPTLIAILSDEKNVRELVRGGCLREAVTETSISGIKRELLPAQILPIASATGEDGLSMQVRYGKERWTFDDECDLAMRQEALWLINAALGNVTPALIGQVAGDVQKWAQLQNL